MRYVSQFPTLCSNIEHRTRYYVIFFMCHFVYFFLFFLRTTVRGSSEYKRLLLDEQDTYHRTYQVQASLPEGIHLKSQGCRKLKWSNAEHRRSGVLRAYIRQISLEVPGLCSCGCCISAALRWCYWNPE